MRRMGSAALLAVVSLAVVACGNGAADTTSEASTTTTTQADTTTADPTTTAAPTPSSTSATTTAPTSTTATPVTADGGVVYLLLEELDPQGAGPSLVPVFRPDIDGQDPVTVVDALLAGPSPEETDGTPTISTAIPEGVDVLDIEVVDGVAALDLSGSFDDGGGSFSMFGRLAQVVFTLTRLDGVDGVLFHLDGQAVTTFSSEGIELDATSQRRADYYDLLPPVFVDRPAWGEPVQSPVNVQGLSNVFEAVSQMMLTDDDGETLHDETVMATCGTGCWGEWDATVDYQVDRDQFGALIVWADSAEDGSRIHVREHLVQLR
jgi:spore germination protein GerM